MAKRRLSIAGSVIAAVLIVTSHVGVARAADASPRPLSPDALHRLVVTPGSPFAPMPDKVLKTGLMEFGNPHSGKIGTVVSVAELKRAKFQRGWESGFRSPDDAVLIVDVFECARSSGASQLVDATASRFPSSYRSVPLAGLPGVLSMAGTSPEGRAVNAAVYSQGRFWVFQETGGAEGAHDYVAILTDLAQRQTAALVAATKKQR